jgi:hypothetical protein
MVHNIINEIAPYVTQRINEWNNFSQFPLKGELWEERLSYAFNDANFPNDWQPDGNHKPGIDFSLDNEPMSFSCKSAVLKNGVLSISSYRTTKYKTLAEKLDYHDSTEAKPFSHYAIVVRDMSNKKQVCIIIDKNYINAKELSWKESRSTRGKTKGNINGWGGTSNKLSMKIQKSMSDQFWYYLDWRELVASDMCTVVCEVEGPNVRL